MRRLILFENFNLDGGTFIDERDGIEYKTIEVNGTIWMAENFRHNFVPKTITKGGFWDMLEIKEPVLKFDVNNGEYYYNFAAAERAAPKGWEIPSNLDWQKLIVKYAEGNTGNSKYRNAFKNLADPKFENESFSRDEMNASGFSVLPFGYYNGRTLGTIKEESEKAFFWTSDAGSASNYRLFYYFNDYGNIGSQGFPESVLMSVRYIKKK